MAYIPTIAEKDATGDLKEIYGRFGGRRGRVPNIMKVMSLNPAALGASADFYRKVIQGTAGLSRAEREMIATVVSRANGCHY